MFKQANVSRAYATLTRNFCKSAAACATAQRSMFLVTKPCPPSPALQYNVDVNQKTYLKHDNQEVLDLLMTPAEHHANVMSQVQNVVYEDVIPGIAPLIAAVDADLLDCEVHACEQNVKLEMSPLFSETDLQSLDVSAITFCHRTKNNIFNWDENMSTEREQLADSFVAAAIEICKSLQVIGYWADFINPYTGKPYLDASTAASLTETDTRLTNFGFTIDDLGCCKVLRHKRFGHQFTIGVVLTNAPQNHPLLRQL